MVDRRKTESHDNRRFYDIFRNRPLIFVSCERTNTYLSEELLVGGFGKMVCPSNSGLNVEWTSFREGGGEGGEMGGRWGGGVGAGEGERRWGGSGERRWGGSGERRWETEVGRGGEEEHISFGRVARWWIC